MPHRAGVQRPAGRVVAHPGDLRLVGHQPDQPQAGPGHDRGGQLGRLRRGADGGAARPGPEPAAQRDEAGVEVHADPDRLRAGHAGRGLLDHVQVVGAVHHHADRGRGGRVAGQPGQRRPVRGRIGHHDVVAGPAGGQPQRLGQGVGQHAPEAGHPQHPLDERAAADRLAGQPDRLARCPPGHGGRVGPQRGQVNDRERRLQVRCRGLVPLPVGADRWPLAARRLRCVPRRRRSAPCTPRPTAGRAAARLASPSASPSATLTLNSQPAP